MAKERQRKTVRRKRFGISRFLFEKLEDETFRHKITWTNKAKGEFCIYWLHASRGEWSVEKDSELFRLWAEHKGKLKEEKPISWKANFRCAMKSRKHELEEVKRTKLERKEKGVRYWRFKDLSLIDEFQNLITFGLTQQKSHSQTTSKPSVKRFEDSHTDVEDYKPAVDVSKWLQNARDSLGQKGRIVKSRCCFLNQDSAKLLSGGHSVSSGSTFSSSSGEDSDMEFEERDGRLIEILERDKEAQKELNGLSSVQQSSSLEAACRFGQDIYDMMTDEEDENSWDSQYPYKESPEQIVDNFTADDLIWRDDISMFGNSLQRKVVHPTVDVFNNGEDLLNPYQENTLAYDLFESIVGLL